MSISIYPGFLSAADCKNFTDGLSETTGWTLSGYQVSQELAVSEPILISAQGKVPIPADNRIANKGNVTASFKKYNTRTKDSGYTLLIFVEGNWKGHASGGGSYNFVPGDLVISQLPIELLTIGRGSRWVIIHQNVRDLGISKTTLGQLFGATAESTVHISIVDAKEDSGESDVDEITAELEEDLQVDDDDSDSESVDLEDGPTEVIET